MDIDKFVENHFGKCSGCRHTEQWRENLAPHGANRRMMKTFAECGHAEAMEDKDLPPEAGKEEPCPYFSSNLSRCREHGHYRSKGEDCPGCVAEAEKKHLEEMKNYRKA